MTERREPASSQVASWEESISRRLGFYSPEVLRSALLGIESGLPVEEIDLLMELKRAEPKMPNFSNDSWQRVLNRALSERAKQK